MFVCYSLEMTEKSVIWRLAGKQVSVKIVVIEKTKNKDKYKMLSLNYKNNSEM